MSVAEVALRSGYVDPAAMTRAFKVEFATTPQALRKGG
jgi:AraC-like DNA-binding protein